MYVSLVLCTLKFDSEIEKKGVRYSVPILVSINTLSAMIVCAEVFLDTDA